jgi:hypothetical protein
MILSIPQMRVLRDALAPYKAKLDENQTAFVAAEFNQQANPAVIAWRTQITMRDAALVPGFDWATIRDMPEGNYRVLSQLTQVGVVHPNFPNVRAAISMCFGEGSEMERLLLDACKRPITRAEALFAVGEGTMENPSQITVEGPLTEADIVKVLGN